VTGLVLSILGLFVGLGIAGLGARVPRWFQLLDGFVLVSVGGLVLLHLAPASVVAGGWWAAGALLVGLAIPIVAERVGRPSAVVAPLAVAGVLVHAFLDGGALTLADHGHGHGHGHELGHGELLAIAVILHRLPIGAALGTVVAPRAGLRTAVGLACAIAVATVGGFVFGDAALHGAPGEVLGGFQGLVAGALLHVVVEHGARVGEPGDRRAAGVGALLGGVALYAVTHGHPLWALVPEELAAGTTFALLALEAGPALVLGLVLTAWVQGTRWRSAAPVDPTAVLLSLPLLGPGITAAWVAGAAVIRWIEPGRVVERPEPAADGVVGLVARLWGPVAATRLPWVAAGVGVGALLEPSLAPGALLAVPEVAQVLLLAAAGLPLVLGAAGVTPLVAVLLHKGVGAGAVLAFLLTAPLPASTSQRQVAVRLLAACAMGYGLDALAGELGGMEIHEVVHHAHPPMEYVAVAAIAILCLGALLREGPRGLMGRMGTHDGARRNE
jgi:hypothetical protein